MNRKNPYQRFQELEREGKSDEEINFILAQEYPSLKEMECIICGSGRIYVQQMMQWIRRSADLSKSGKSIQEILTIKKEEYPLLEMAAKRSSDIRTLIGAGKSNDEIISTLEYEEHDIFGAIREITRQRDQWHIAKRSVTSIFETSKKEEKSEMKQRRRDGRWWLTTRLILILLPIIISIFISIIWGIFIVLVYIIYKLIKK